MKSFNKYFLISTLCLIFSLTTLAQEKERYISHPDTLRIELSNGQAIDFAFENVRNVEFETDFNAQWLEAINRIQILLKLESINEPVRIRVINKIFENELKDIVEIEELNANKKIYMISNNTLQNIANFNEVVFEIDQIKVKLRLANLSYLAELKNFDFTKLQEQLEAKKQNVHLDYRKKYYLSTALKANSYADLKLSDDGVADFIELTGGIGIGLFRDKLAPEFSLKAAITIGDKHGIHLHKFGVQSTFHYMFDRATDDSYDMNVNTFLTAFYKHNFSKSTLKDKWAGIGIGYLVKNSGNYFGENTFKVGLFLNAQQSSIDIIPEIIITDNFSTVFPSLRLGLTF